MNYLLLSFFDSQSTKINTLTTQIVKPAAAAAT